MGARTAVFRLDERTMRERLGAARAASSGEARAILDRGRRGAGLDLDGMAILWLADLDTAALYDAAGEVKERRPAPLETFSPLYVTNTCDAECRMCGMRRDNDALHRETADSPRVEQQLDLLQRRGMNAVAILTGEYRRERRSWAIDFVNQALRATQERGFGHVLINVGSIDEDEYPRLLDGIERRPDGAVRAKMTMCTFQETYSREHYRKFMGTNADNPRADFDRRLANFDRAFEAGLRVANPGILVGLDPDLGFEMLSLAAHARHLLDLGMEVYLSVPRLRQTAGSLSPRSADDETFTRLVAILSMGVPDAKIVLTTRESAEVQRRLVPIVSVLSAGSAAVTPYTGDGARFDLESSQFEVVDQRPFEDILGAVALRHGPIENFTSPERHLGPSPH